MAAGSCCTAACGWSCAVPCGCGRWKCALAGALLCTGWRATAWGSTPSTTTTWTSRPSCTAAASSSLVRLGLGGGSVLKGVGLGPPWAAGTPSGQFSTLPAKVGATCKQQHPSRPLPRVSLLLVSGGLVSTKGLWLLFCLHREVQIEVSVHKRGKST